MVGIRELFGEIKGKDVIKAGDRVRIITVDDKKYVGILREATKLKIKINGKVKLEFDVDKILDIKKID